MEAMPLTLLKYRSIVLVEKITGTNTITVRFVFDNIWCLLRALQWLALARGRPQQDTKDVFLYQTWVSCLETGERDRPRENFTRPPCSLSMSVVERVCTWPVGFFSLSG